MNTHNTLEQLRKLHLGGMGEALQMQLEQVGTYADLAFTERHNWICCWTTNVNVDSSANSSEI